VGVGDVVTVVGVACGVTVLGLADNNTIVAVPVCIAAHGVRLQGPCHGRRKHSLGLVKRAGFGRDQLAYLDQCVGGHGAVSAPHSTLLFAQVLECDGEMCDRQMQRCLLPCLQRRDGGF
jgi:hypothetical protein